MNVELVDRYGSVVPAALGFGEDEVVFESGQSVTIGALLLLGYTIRKAVEA